MGRASTASLVESEERTVPVSVRLPQSLVDKLDAWGQAVWKQRWGGPHGPRLTRTALIAEILSEKLSAPTNDAGPAKARPRRKRTSRAA